MRARRDVFAFALIAAAIVACDGDKEPYSLGYNKGCPNLSVNCAPSYYASDAAAPQADPPFEAPAACPSKRTDAARADLTTNEVRTLLPGLYTSCADGTPLRVHADANGNLEASGEPIVVGACGTTGCDAAWGSDVGTLQVYADPAAFSFIVDGEVDSYVREGD